MFQCLMKSRALPGDMFDGVLEEHKLDFLGEGHVVVVQVVLQDVPDLLGVCQVLVGAVGLLCSDLGQSDDRLANV